MNHHQGSPRRGERIWYSSHERKEILKANYGVCACCGKKLNVNTMTIDHIIPRSRGGSNGQENLTALCYDCNQKKGNDFYLPVGCYHAIRDTVRFRQMSDYVAAWYQSLPADKQTDLRMHPLLTPKAFVSLVLGSGNGFAGHRKKQMGFHPGLTIRWDLVGHGMREEVEAVTGEFLFQIRNHVVNEMARQMEENPLAGVYVLKKVTTDKLLLLAVCRYVEEQEGFYLYIPWADMPKGYLAGGVKSFVELIRMSLIRVAGKRVTGFVIESRMKHALDAFLGSYEMEPFIRTHYTYQEVEVHGETHHEIWVGQVNGCDRRYRNLKSKISKPSVSPFTVRACPNKPDGKTVHPKLPILL